MMRMKRTNADFYFSSAFVRPIRIVRVPTLCNSPDAVIKCRQCRLCTFTHCNYYLFVGNVRNISCRINTRNRGAAKSIELDYAYRSRLKNVKEKSTYGCQTNLYEDTIQWEIPFFAAYTIFDADSCYLITVSHYFGSL